METLKPNELRLGNLVEYPYWNKDGSPAYFKVRDIFTDDAKIALTNGIIQLPSSHLDCIAPIPITKEWIQTMGMCRVNEEWWVLRNINIEWTNLHWNESIGFELSVSKLCVPLSHIKYIHQLQNLYFALTNEELTVKL